MKTIDLVPPSVFVLLSGLIFLVDELRVSLLPAVIFLALLIVTVVASVMWVNGNHPTKK